MERDHFRLRRLLAFDGGVPGVVGLSDSCGKGRHRRQPDYTEGLLIGLRDQKKGASPFLTLNDTVSRLGVGADF